MKKPGADFVGQVVNLTPIGGAVWARRAVAKEMASPMSGSGF